MKYFNLHWNNPYVDREHMQNKFIYIHSLICKDICHLKSVKYIRTKMHSKRYLLLLSLLIQYCGKFINKVSTLMCLTLSRKLYSFNPLYLFIVFTWILMIVMIEHSRFWFYTYLLWTESKSAMMYHISTLSSCLFCFYLA